MSTPGRESGAGDPSRVRLSWPGEAHTPASSEDLPHQRVDVEADDDASGADRIDHLRSLPVVEADAVAGMALRRAMVDGYDRLADRVLHRLQVVREDLDADLADLRSEVTSLREAVEDVGNRVQLRQLRSAIDELRSDVAGLRRVVLEWPELERVSADITALRADMADIIRRLADSAQLSGPAAPLGSLAPLVEEIAALRGDLPSLEPVADELAGLRGEVAALRRRIALRVGEGSDTPAGRKR